MEAMLFLGQGYKHGLGYCTVQSIGETRLQIGADSHDNPKYKFVPDLDRITVKFESGATLVVKRDSLRNAEMPQSELEFLLAKYGYVESEEELEAA